MTGLNQNRVLAVCLAIMAILNLVPSAGFASRTFEPIYNPLLKVSKSAGEISIDGRLSDLGWKNAACASNFVERQPGDKTRPAVETKAFITYDNKNLYVAFLCYDNPRDIRATMCDRDQFHSDDAVCVLLDTYGNASWAYEFFVNPYGVQKDNLWSTVAGEDPGFDLIWHSAAQITDSGYQVELAIPFSSMRFPSKSEQNWKIDFYRNRPRENFNQYSWAAYDRDEQCWPCQWGMVEGIGNVVPGKGLEILPSYVATQSGSKLNLGDPESKFDSGKPKGELSLGSKYSVSSNITLEAAFNPDFSQIEADADQIDVNSTIALFYPERRPFFQEGSDVFRTLFQSFYTRTVNDPIFAAKTIGRMEKTTFGILTAYDENTPYIIPLKERSIFVNSGKSMITAARTIHAIGGNSQIGLLVTDRRFEAGGAGSILALDGDIRLTKSLSMDGQFIASYIREPKDTTVTSEFNGLRFNEGEYTVDFDGESYYGHAFITRLKRFSRTWNFIINYNQVSPSYRTETGYDPVIDYRNASSWNQYVIYVERGIIDRLYPQIYMSRRWNFDGTIQRENLVLTLGGNLNFAQSGFEIQYGWNAERFEGRNFNDLWGLNFNFDSRPLDQIGFHAFLARSRNVAYFALSKGSETSAGVSFMIKPVDRLIIEPDLTYSRSVHYETGEELYTGYITRTRVRYQANREIALRLVVQYNDFSERLDVDPLLTYRISPFSVFYLGSTYDYQNLPPGQQNISDWRLTSRQFFMKLQYLFQT